MCLIELYFVADLRGTLVSAEYLIKVTRKEKSKECMKMNVI